MWHYRFMLKGREFSGPTGQPATRQNREAASLIEQAARGEARRSLQQHVWLGSVNGPSPIAVGRKKETVARFKSGCVAELTVCAELMAKGYDVYRPIDPRAPCDLIYWDGTTLIRVEVKFIRTGTEKRLDRDLLRNFGKFDILALVNEEGKIEYIPEEEVKERIVKNREAGWSTAKKASLISAGACDEKAEDCS